MLKRSDDSVNKIKRNCSIQVRVTVKRSNVTQLDPCSKIICYIVVVGGGGGCGIFQASSFTGEFRG